MTRNKNTPPPRWVITRSQSQTVSNVPPIVNAGQARTSVAGQSFPLITPSPISGTSQGHLASPMQPRDQTPFMLQASRFASVSTPEQGVHVLPQSLAPQPVHSPLQQQYIPESHWNSSSLSNSRRPSSSLSNNSHCARYKKILFSNRTKKQLSKVVFQSRLLSFKDYSSRLMNNWINHVLSFNLCHWSSGEPTRTWSLSLENGDERFWRAVRKEVFLHDALPEFRAQVAAVKILKEMHNVNDPYNEHFRYTATEDVV
ncbi:hypothetical protein BJV82DRAFT_584200 [Fennellomyces sp. T-0311]|nr:hypothetical protein BJV82DRAFT_584200 [Fennellomyces sp. T-0311]